MLRSIIDGRAFMSDFASILQSVERDAAQRLDPRRGPAMFRMPPGETRRQSAHDLREASRAYAACAAQAARNDDAIAPNVAALRRAIAAAGQDRLRLHALRRLAARALHPDLGGDGAALAQCNALIDAALEAAAQDRGSPLRSPAQARNVGA